MQSSSMSSKKRNLSGSFNAVGAASGSMSGGRPSSAKEGRPTSSSGAGRSSARSTASMESDFLSITGARKVPQKSRKHKRTQSGTGRYSFSQGEVSGSDSERTSSSSGVRNKTVNVNQQGNLRFAENHVTPVILSQTKAKAKPKLATNFQIQKTATSSPSYLPNKLQGAGRNAAANHTNNWWSSANDQPLVPPLELKSPSDLKQERRWWPANSGDPSPASDYFSESKNDENWWEGLKNEDIEDDNILASWENVKPEDSKHASHKSDVPNLSLDGLLGESQSQTEFKQQRAAVTIQRWVRGWIVRRRTNHRALKELLSQKKQEREKQMAWGQENVVTEEQLREKKDKERMKRREEQARLARQAAIQELQQQRENKRQENQRKAQEELQFLQASGKVTKKKANTATKTKAKRPGSVGADAGSAQLNLKGRNSAGANNAKETPRPGTSSSVGRKVDEIFQETRTVKITQNNATHTEENLSFPAATDRTDKTLTRSELEGGSKTTFDDLLESLKQLEEQPKCLSEDQNKGNVMRNWVSDLEDTKEDTNKPYLSVESLEQLHAAKTVSSQGAQGTSLSAEKLRNILTFLDEVEKAEEDARSEINQVREGAVSHGLPSPSASTSLAVDREKEMSLMASASAAASDVTQAMMAVKIELEEKKRTGELLQRALNQQREFTLHQAKEMEKDAKVRIVIQRQEYEAAIQRHLTFIDQLIDDKKVLSERCEELVKKLKEIDKKYSDKVKQMEENHLIQTKKQKDVIIAAEKIRREKWINEKTQQIKEVTVKGLEPDIQKLIAKHKAEMKRLKSVHQAELLETDERAGRRYVQQIEELRDQLEREKEMACSRERELAQKRYEQQMGQEEQAYQQQRRRLYAEVQEEKERLALQGQKQRQELDEARAALEGSHKKSAVDQHESFQKTLEDTERRHQLEVNELKERLEIEKQGWIENYMKKQDAVLLAKERELKEGVREARDREIEMVISRLEDETALTREECERAAENRIKRVRDKYESELKELEASEHNMHQKFNTMKERLTEVEGECSRFRSLLKQKEQETEDVDKIVKRLQEERGKVSDIIRQEFADRLVTTDEDNKRLKTEMSEMKARHRLETERIKREKEQEMEELHKRVKQAIAKKEETTKMLREQQQAAMKRADHLEMLLQQQREHFLK